MVWDGIEARAVVPSSSLSRARDVVCPTNTDITASPYPLGLGVSLLTSSSKFLGSMAMPLLYVSETVARERSPYANRKNPSGVEPGWYLIAQPGMQFEVVLTKVNSMLPKVGNEDQFSTRLFVDGIYTHQRVVFQDRKEVGVQLRAKGFVQKREVHHSGDRKKIVKVFTFGSTEKSIEDNYEDNREVGTIRADLSMEKRSRKPDYGRIGNFKYDGQLSLSEREIVKYGRSLVVRHDGPKSMLLSRQSFYAPEESRLVPEGEITIFVREASWMRSRRLIDDTGRPCTHEMYVAMLEEETKLQEMRMNSNHDYGHMSSALRNMSRNGRSWRLSRPLLAGSSRKDEYEW